MPNSKARKKRLAEKQRRESKPGKQNQPLERRLSTTSMNPALLSDYHDTESSSSKKGNRGRRLSFSGANSRIRRDSSSSDSGSESAMGDNAGLVSSAYTWLSYGLDYIIPSRKLVRELEETKEKLKETEDMLRQEKKKRKSTLGVKFAGTSVAAVTPPPAAPAPPPPPPPPPPPVTSILPRKLVIKKGAGKSSKQVEDDKRPLVTINDLLKIKLKPAARVSTRAQAKKEGIQGGPMVSLQQLQSVQLKRSRAQTMDDPSALESERRDKSPCALPFAKRLRRVDIKRSPGGTPIQSQESSSSQYSKHIPHVSASSRQRSANKENVDMTPMLSVALRRRFSTAKLHSPMSPSDTSDSSFLSGEFDGFA